VSAGRWVYSHGIEVRTPLPLRVVHHLSAIDASVNVGRDESRHVLHEHIGGFHQHVDQFLLVLRSTKKMFTNVITGSSVLIVVTLIRSVSKSPSTIGPLNSSLSIYASGIKSVPQQVSPLGGRFNFPVR
jgi:hypothetical protein